MFLNFEYFPRPKSNLVLCIWIKCVAPPGSHSSVNNICHIKIAKTFKESRKNFCFVLMYPGLFYNTFCMWHLKTTSLFKIFLFAKTHFTSQYLLNRWISNIRHNDFRPPSFRPPSRSRYPPWILKRGGLESSGRRLISLTSKTKRIAYFFLFLFSANKYNF